MFGDVPTFQYAYPTDMGTVYFWRPGSDKPVSLMPHTMVAQRPFGNSIKLIRYWADSAKARFATYIVFGIFGASSVYAVFFQYLSSQNSQPDDMATVSDGFAAIFSSGNTEIDLGVSFYAFLSCVILSILAHVLAVFITSFFEIDSSEITAQLYLMPATVVDLAALTAAVLGVIRMGAALNMTIDLEFLLQDIRAILFPLAIMPICFAFSLALLTLQYSLWKYRNGIRRSFLSAKKALAKLKAKTFGTDFSAREDAAEAAEMANRALTDRPAPLRPFDRSIPTRFPNLLVKDAVFFLEAWVKYGGVIQHVLKRRVDFFALPLEVQVKIFMQTLTAYCGPGEWVVFRSPASVESNCSSFLRLASRWFEAVEELRTRSFTDLSDRSMRDRVRSLLELEEVLILTLEAPATKPSTETESSVSSATGVDGGTTGPRSVMPDARADGDVAPSRATHEAPSTSFPPTEVQSPSDAPYQSSAYGSHITIDLLPLPTTYPPEPITTGQAGRPPSSRAGFAGRVSGSPDQREGLNLPGRVPSSVSPSQPKGAGNISPGPQSTNQRTGGDLLSGDSQVTVGKDSITAGAVSRGAAVGSVSTQLVHVEHSPPSHVTNRTSDTGGAACSGANTVEHRCEGLLNAAEDCSATGSTWAEPEAGMVQASSLAGEASLGV